MCFLLEFATVIHFNTARYILCTCFYYNYEQINVGWKVIKVVLNLGNFSGVWRDERKIVKRLHQPSWWMKQINEANLDLFEVNPWLWVTTNNFRLYKHFSSNVMTKSNDVISHLLSIIGSLLVEKVVLPNQTILLPY